jgi:phosphatidylinositol alpha-1,6-mannosyltransferase
VPQVAGASGGSADAVVHGTTGLVVDDPKVVDAVAAALRALLVDESRRASMRTAGRDRAVRDLAYDVLAARLAGALDDLHEIVRARRGGS